MPLDNPKLLHLLLGFYWEGPHSLERNRERFARVARRQGYLISWKGADNKTVFDISETGKEFVDKEIASWGC